MIFDFICCDLLFHAAYNNRYEMESESENEDEYDDNQTYSGYPGGESLINPSPQHIPQQENHTVTSSITIGLQKNGDDFKIVQSLDNK